MIIDALYGESSFGQPLADILWCPEIQRLRHVFLSNIPSFDMPGIAQVSRFEHAIGTMVLAGVVARARGLDEERAVTLQTAALLHDAAMPGLGHLMEEAFALAGRSFDHESHLESLFSGKVDAGGTAFQIFDGQEVGFRRELDRHGLPAHVVTEALTTIRGGGALGPLLNGSVDIDNIDNVCRIAFHMGLRFRQELPIMLARVLAVADGTLRMGREGLALVKEWQQLRTEVYRRLMFAPRDFAAKTMLVRTLARLIARGANGGLLDEDWRLTYEEVTDRLRGGCREEARVFGRLYAGNLYETAALVWIHGDFPGLPNLIQHEQKVAKMLGHECWLYAIPDKRHRPVTVRVTDNDEVVTVGQQPDGWLFGACISQQRSISAAKIDRLIAYITDACGGRGRRVYDCQWPTAAQAIERSGPPARLFD